MFQVTDLKTMQQYLEQLADFDQVQSTVDDLAFYLCLQWLWKRLDESRKRALLEKARELAAG
jgi:hypothetical protein